MSILPGFSLLHIFDTIYLYLVSIFFVVFLSDQAAILSHFSYYCQRPKKKAKVPSSFANLFFLPWPAWLSWLGHCPGTERLLAQPPVGARAGGSQLVCLLHRCFLLSRLRIK